MSSANKKQRREAKRKAKKKEIRRREGVSPVKRLADARGEVECWMSDDFEENGQLQIYAFKRAAGLSGVACFLVDRGVVGLKDAWSRMGVEAEDQKYMLETSRGRNITMRRVDVEEARRWVAGAARWAHDNGMRLPEDWIKCTLLIGGAGDWASADVSNFAKEFVGHPEDLRQRLIGEPLESYVKRKDIDFIFDERAPYKNQGTGEYIPANDEDFDDLDGLDEEDARQVFSTLSDKDVAKLLDSFTPAANDLVTQTTEWLAMQGESPSPQLFEAWRSLMLSSILSQAVTPQADAAETAALGADILAMIFTRLYSDQLDEHEGALAQALKYFKTDPLLIYRAAEQYGLEGAGDVEETEDT